MKNTMSDFEKIARIIKEHKTEFRQHFGVKELGIFGSFSRGDMNEASDIDVLVEFEAGQKTFDHFMDLKYQLEELLGRDVDLVTVDALRPQMKDEILRDVTYA